MVPLPYIHCLPLRQRKCHLSERTLLKEGLRQVMPCFTHGTGRRSNSKALQAAACLPDALKRRCIGRIKSTCEYAGLQ